MLKRDRYTYTFAVLPQAFNATEEMSKFYTDRQAMLYGYNDDILRNVYVFSGQSVKQQRKKK